MAAGSTSTVQRVERKDGEIVALRPDLTPIVRLAGAGHRAGALAGAVVRPGQSQAAVETLEIAHEGLQAS